MRGTSTALRLPKSRRRSALKKSQARVGFVLALPVVILIGVFVFWPTIQAIYYSFTNWNGSTSTFVGLGNYKSSLLSGPGVHRILFNNLIFIVSVPLAVAFE